MTTDQTCRICGNTAETYPIPQKSPDDKQVTFYIDCPTCGRWSTTRTARAMGPWDRGLVQRDILAQREKGVERPHVDEFHIGKTL